ncbi:Hypothetical predicted protein, partial [Marmota monax]
MQLVLCYSCGNPHLPMWGSSCHLHLGALQPLLQFPTPGDTARGPVTSASHNTACHRAASLNTLLNAIAQTHPTQNPNAESSHLHLGTPLWPYLVE